MPAIMALSDDYSEQLRHRVIHTLHIAVAIRVVGASGKTNADKLVSSVRNIGANWRQLSESMLRMHPQWAMRWLMRKLELPSAISWPAATAYMSARRLKRSAKSKTTQLCPKK